MGGFHGAEPTRRSYGRPCGRAVIFTDPRLRAARPADAGDIARLVHELAEYERAPGEAVATSQDFAAALFPSAGDPVAYCHLAEVDGRVVGVALWFTTFSTWTGRPGIWLEDLFVEPSHRGSGLGKALLTSLAQVCVDRGWPRLDWCVLNWNEPSIAFYRSLGAHAQDDWTTYRLTGTPLRTLGSRVAG